MRESGSSNGFWWVGPDGSNLLIASGQVGDGGGAFGEQIYIVTSAALSRVTVKGDCDGDWDVDVPDLLILLGSWGYVGWDRPGEFNWDGQIDVQDLLTLLSRWG